jgi:solute:Na+ symporter, SSS family
MHMNLVNVSIIIYFLAMIPLAIYLGRKVKNSQDYVLAGRSLPFYMAFFTVFATWYGSESILGVSSKFSEGGFSSVIEDPFGAALCLIIAGIFFNRKLYNLKFLTISDYFENRYNKFISIFLTVVIVISYFGWVAAQFLALGMIASFLFNVTLLTAIVFVSVVVVIYTYFGGMFSIAVLDTIQSVVIILGMLAVLFVTLPLIGGLGNLISITPVEYFNVLPTDHSFTNWAIFLTAIMTLGFGSIPQQDIYQRAMSAKSATISSWASISAGVFYFFMVMIPITIAMTAKNIYPHTAESNSENLIMHLVMNNTNELVQILFFGALFSAIFSTASGAILAPATLLSENIFRPIFLKLKKDFSDQKRLFVIRLSVIFVSFVAIFFASRPEAHIYELVGSAYTVTLVVAFVPLAFGLYSKSFINSTGAVISIFAGAFAFALAHYTSSIIPPAFFGFLASFVGIIIGSFLSKYFSKINFKS